MGIRDYIMDKLHRAKTAVKSDLEARKQAKELVASGQDRKALKKYREDSAVKRYAIREREKLKEKEVYRKESHKQKIKDIKSRAKGRSNFFGNTPSLLGNTGPFSNNSISGPFSGNETKGGVNFAISGPFSGNETKGGVNFGSGGLSRNVITGEPNRKNRR